MPQQNANQVREEIVKPQVPHKPVELLTFRKRDSHIAPSPTINRKNKKQDSSYQQFDYPNAYPSTQSYQEWLGNEQAKRPQSQQSNISITSKPRPKLRQKSFAASNLEGSAEDEKMEVAKIIKTRQTIINEIITTERHYLSDLLILRSVFVKKAIEQALLSKDDLRLLFGNIDPVIGLSTDILAALLAEYNKGNYNAPQQVGRTFLHFMDEIKAKYGSYCKNNEDSLDKLKELMQDQRFQAYFKECQLEMKDQIDAWDLASLIIKPVQRVLKYPLLLKRLLEYTDETVDGYQDLIQAVELVKGVALMINELKKRKDLVEKYTLGKGNSNVIHGISKKYQRAAQTLKQATGTISYTPDPEFAKVHEKYLEITQTIPKLEKSIRDYLKVEKEILQTNRNLGFFYQQLSTETSAGLNIQDEYLNGIFDITAKQYKNLVINIENLFEILKTLMELTKGPNLILKKHQSKELDHSRYIESDGLDLDLKLSSDDFLGLNAQLLEELPVFSRLLKEVVGVFVRGFLEVRQNYVLELKGFLGDVLKNDFESFGLKMDMGGSVEQSARGIELIKDWRCSIWGGLDLDDFELVGTEDGVSTGVSTPLFGTANHKRSYHNRRKTKC